MEVFSSQSRQCIWDVIDVAQRSTFESFLIAIFALFSKQYFSNVSLYSEFLDTQWKVRRIVVVVIIR